MAHAGAKVDGLFNGTLASAALGFASTDYKFALAGGTGRFAHATGSGACTLTVEPDAPVSPVAAAYGIVAETFTGSIEP